MKTVTIDHVPRLPQTDRNGFRSKHKLGALASFPGRSHLQFLIAYCMQKRIQYVIKNWRREWPGNEARVHNHHPPKYETVFLYDRGLCYCLIGDDLLNKQSVFPVILALRRNNKHTHTQDWAEVSTLWCLVHNSVWLRYMTIYIKVSGGFGKNKLNSIHLLCQNDLAT